ncbi:hypothetical protein DL98DRAFT_590032 [Cadophora sp. DSE1049]|nr:hypothetical protein DL98DRAFT_590032 [Cadophora sp. DSE1049]
MADTSDSSDSDKMKTADTPATASALRKREEIQLTFTGAQTFVTFYVGIEPDPQSFILHKTLACHSSPVFEAAFKSQFVEGQTQSMNFDDVEPDTFALLVDWMYLQKVQRPDNKAISHPEYVKIWVLAERCLIPRLQNQAIISLIAGKFSYKGPRWLELKRYIYEHTTETVHCGGHFFTS